MSSMAIDAETVRELVTGAQQGDRVAADRLVREHESWVRSAIYAATGRPELVDDIAQQVWMRVWQRLDTLENPRQLRAWLYTIARNTAIDYGASHRRQQGFAERMGAEGRRTQPPAAEPAGTVANAEVRELVLRAVRSLPAIYREPFVLRHLEGWSYQEIGDVLGLTVDTVETRLVRARRLLREMLQGRVES